MAQAREELAKKEREMMDQLLKLRKEQELEIAQKRIAMEKEANDRYQKVYHNLCALSQFINRSCKTKCLRMNETEKLKRQYRQLSWKRSTKRCLSSHFVLYLTCNSWHEGWKRTFC